MRVSNGIAIVLLFAGGYILACYAGLRRSTTAVIYVCNRVVVGGPDHKLRRMTKSCMVPHLSCIHCRVSVSPRKNGDAFFGMGV